jgi:hypothetical protein
MPSAYSGRSLDWFTALALNIATQEGKRISGLF